MSDFILQIRVYDYMHIVANMTNDFFIVSRRFLCRKIYRKALKHDFAIFKTLSTYISKCSWYQNAILSEMFIWKFWITYNSEPLNWLISFLSKMNWALIVTITERNQKDFLRLSETRLRYSLLLGQQNRLISTLQLINIANVFSYRHTMLIRPWHSLNINQFHSHSFVFNRRLVYFFKNSL